jgi:hypothetical protein
VRDSGVGEKICSSWSAPSNARLPRPTDSDGQR